MSEPHTTRHLPLGGHTLNPAAACAATPAWMNTSVRPPAPTLPTSDWPQRMRVRRPSRRLVKWSEGEGVTADKVARDWWIALTENSPRSPRNSPKLPLAAPVPVPAKSTTHYVASSIDRDGRLANRSALQPLGWDVGAGVAFHVRQGAFFVVTDRNQGRVINGQGHLCLPVSVRRACHLEKGDRVLLAIYPSSGMLIGLPFPLLDRVLQQYAKTLREPSDDD